MLGGNGISDEFGIAGAGEPRSGQHLRRHDVHASSGSRNHWHPAFSGDTSRSTPCPTHGIQAALPRIGWPLGPNQLLGDLGADVVKVERPGWRRRTRAWGCMAQDGNGRDTKSPYFLCANRNKRSIAIDFTGAEGRALVRRLAECADVLIEISRWAD